MTLAFSEHPEAKDELKEAARYYEVRQVGLGDDLLSCADSAVDDLLDSPDAWPPFPGWDAQPLIRWHGIDRYPYRVVYYVKDVAVHIIAYAHISREPAYWRNRI